MLVLTRKRDGVIRIGENIVIRVIRTGKTSVKIGIDAPANVRVVRGELSPLLVNTGDAHDSEEMHSEEMHLELAHH
ncbi:MAG TPA: carbon storage regulator [Planctomycetaceae bacterium]|nr:carbon storage regulator [Planctomycetaceae bacterium]